MNRLELRYEIYKSLVGLNRPAAIKSAELIDASPAEPEFAIEVITDDPYNLTDPGAVRRYRVTIEEVTD